MNPDELDELLRSGPPRAPADFSARVMQQLSGPPSSKPQPEPQRQPQPRPHPRPHPQPLPPPRWQTLAQWLALIAAAALGISQVLAFIFGLWAVTAAAAA